MNKTHDCPICQAQVLHSERYPKQVCNECSERTCDANGRNISFMSWSFAGGLLGTYSDTGARYTESFCYIDGIKCRAEEDRFGRGIIIEAVE